MFTSWKKAAEPDMKKYLTLKSGLRKITNVMITEPFYQIIAISEREKVNENKVFYLLKFKKSQYTLKVLKAWKEAVEEAKLENLKIMHINSHFKASTGKLGGSVNDQDSELTFELFKNNTSHPIFKLPSKLQIQINCIKIFQVHTEMTPAALLRKYFNAMKYNSKLKKIRREQHDYSAVYYCQNMKRKYLRKLVEIYNDNIDEQQNMQRAMHYYDEKTLVKYWIGLLEGVKNSKREAVCDAIHKHNLKRKTLMGFYENITLKTKKAKLKELYQKFIESKKNRLVKNSYFTWKHHHALESYYNKAISEFEEYRTMRFKKRVLIAFLIVAKVRYFCTPKLMYLI